MTVQRTALALLLAVVFAGSSITITAQQDPVLDHPLSDYAWRISHAAGIDQAIVDWGTAATGSQVGVATIGHINWRSTAEHTRWSDTLGAPLTLRKLLEDRWPSDASPDPPPPPSSNRTPDPAPGTRVPLPYEEPIMEGLGEKAGPILFQTLCPG